MKRSVDEYEWAAVLQELLSGIDENAAVPFHLGIAVADVTSTDDFLASLEGTKDEL